MSVIAGINSEISSLNTQNDELPQFRQAVLDTAARFEVPSIAMDKLALDEFEQMIQIQNHIITAGSNIGLASEFYSGDVNVFSTNYGDLVTGIGTTQGQYTPIIGVGSETQIAFGSLKLDVLEAHRMPKVEDGTLDTSTDNPFIGEGYVNVTSGNAGIGNSTRLSRGAGAGTTVYALVGDGYTNSGIVTLRSAYNSLNSGIGTFINAATEVKTEKNQNRLIAWSLGRKIASNTTRKTSAEDLIDTLENPGFGGPY